MKKLCILLAVVAFLAGCGAPSSSPSAATEVGTTPAVSPAVGTPTPERSVSPGVTPSPAAAVAQPDKMTLTDKNGKKVALTLGMRSGEAESAIQNADFGKYTDTGDVGSETISGDGFLLIFMPYNEGSEYTLSSIAFTTKKYATVAGLKVGDSKARMEELYGKNYKQYDPADYAIGNGNGQDPGMSYEYVMGGHYLNIIIQDGIVKRWSVERYDYDTFNRRLIPPGMPGSYWG